MTPARQKTPPSRSQRTTAPITAGYVRTVVGQSPVSQINRLTQAGVAEDDIYIERAGGAKTAWPERDLLLARLHHGDTLKITRLDRLFYSVQNLIVLGVELRERGVRLHALDQDIDSDTIEGRDLFGMLSALAELQLQFVTANTNDGLAIARARGNTGGRPPVLNAEQVEQVLRLHETGASVPQLARKFRASRATIYRQISLAKQEHL